MEAARRPYARDPLDDYALEPGVAEKVTFQLMDREQARLDKDFKTADSIREQLEELGVVVDDRARTWQAGPPPKEKPLDLNSAAVTAALTLHPEVWISDFGAATEAELNELFRADFPGVSFRMDREKLEDESDEEDTRFGAGSLESIVLREASEDLRGAEDEGEEPKKLGKSKGFGHLKLESAEQAKDFIYRFEGFPYGEGNLKVRISKQSLQGSTSWRSKKMTHHDRRLKALRQEERSRAQAEKDAFASAQEAARAAAPVKPPPEEPRRARTVFGNGSLLKKRPQPPGNAAQPSAAAAKAGPGGSSSSSSSSSDDEGGGDGGALGGLISGYGGGSSSSSSSDSEDESHGPPAKRRKGPEDQAAQSVTTAPQQQQQQAKAAGQGSSPRFKPAAFVASAKSKNSLAVEAMRAKMVGDTKTYAELMERINRGEGATD